MKLLEDDINGISQYFKSKPVLKAYLFGSQARENAHEQSDIDILVELDYSQRIGLLFVTMKLELEEILNQKVDLVTEKGISKYIKTRVNIEKKLIYER